jgi:predicted RNA methylase/ribosomal protein S18 acetylase RimI-like enzyme
MAEPADDKDNARKLAPVGAIFVGMVAARNLARRGDDRPLKALEHAERLRKSGAGESQIYTETNKMFEGSPYAGVSYGADRKPRFEISDHNAKLVPAALDKSGSGTMGRFLKNDTYYQAHPDAALLDVQKSAGGGGSFDGYKVTIGSNHFAAKQLLGRPVAKETARGVALHEKQHHAQDVEGFAPGGSPKDFETRVDRSGKRVQLSAGESREMYRRLAGEVEAENTRRRANMTPAERRAIHPSKTAEFARKDQIVTDRHGRVQETRQKSPLDLHTEGHREVKIGNSRIGYQVKADGTVHVSGIRTAQANRGKGSARAAMNEFLATADAKGVNVDLHASPLDRRTGTAGLVRFYESLGFQKTGRTINPMGDPAMVRPAKPRIQEMAEDIKDFGEKIGGSRKDRAVKTGPKPARPEAPADTRPGWQKRFLAAETMSQGKPTGQWTLLDTRKKGRYMGHPSATRQTFPSQAAAEAAIPYVAVAQKHVVRESYGIGPDGKTDTSKSQFEIWRRVSDRKAVKAVNETFSSRDAAIQHMASNAERLLGTAKGYGEEILARPEKVVRTGPEFRQGDAKPEQFLKEFRFRGVEFGNWQGDRQSAVNMAYDAMRDLADITGVKPESLTFKERLALAFGARGNGGKQSAAAHYERTYAAVNLTREKGAGHLAHEWMHGLDHYLGTLDDPKLAQTKTDSHGNKILNAGSRETDYASHRVVERRAGELNSAVRDAYRELVDTMLKKPEQVTVEANRYEKQSQAARERLKGELDTLRRDLATEQRYGKKTAPATAEQLAKFDAIAEKLVAGEGVETKRILNPSMKSARNTNDAAESLSAIMKEVRGRAGWDSQAEQGPMDRLARSMNAVASAEKMLAQAKASPVQTVMTHTDFVREAARLDQSRNGAYWNTRHELAARAFSAYVEDKLAAAGRQSNYLAFGSDNKFYGLFGVKPFPEGSERQAINSKFDKLFEAMRQTEVMQPAGGATASGIKMAATAQEAMAQANAEAAKRVTIDGKPPGWSDAARAKSAEVRAADAKPEAVAAPAREVRQEGKRFTVHEGGKPIKDSKGADKWFGSKEKADAFLAKRGGSAPAAKPMSYERALSAAQGKIGSVQGDPHLAITAQTLSQAHPGISPKMLYDGAKALGLSAGDLRTKPMRDLANVMFAESATTTGESSTPKRDVRAKVEAKPRAAVAGDNGGPSEKAIKTAAKLEAVAKRTAETSQKIADQPRLMNTARRARMGGGVIDEAMAQKAHAQTALKIAGALRNGEAGNLANVKSLADVRALNSLYRSAMHEADRVLKRPYEAGKAPSPADIEHVKMPRAFIRASGSDIDAFRKVLPKGYSRDLALIEKHTQAAERAGNFGTADERVIEATKRVAKAVSEKGGKHDKYRANNFLSEIRDYDRIRSLGIDSADKLKAVLRDYVAVRSDKPKADPVALAERDLIGRKLPGFFPTPQTLAERMAQMAEIKPGMQVLEPSAGTGRLADAAKKLGAQVDAVEMQSSLRDILMKKGHNVVEHDFTSMKAEPKYDRIVMNPPFEKGQDIAHVRQAYDMLKPGGKMVAVMGEGAFFRGDTKASEFRNWLETVGTSEKLPEGTFKESNTGVNTRLVTITKPAEASSAVKNENRGWSDAARAASADARGVAKPGEAKPKPSPTVQSAVERAMAMQEAKAKASAPSTLVKPSTPTSQQLPDKPTTPAGMSGSGSKRYVTLGNGQKVGLGQYTNAWRQAKAMNPETGVRGTPSDPSGGGTAGDLVREMRAGMVDRINQKDPNYGKGRKWDATWQSDARRLADTMARKSEVPAGEAHPVDLRNKVADRLAPGTKLPPKGGTGIKGKVMGLMAPVAIGSAALIAMNESAKAGETTGQQVKAGSIEAVKGGAVMGGFVAGTIAITKGLTKAGLTAAKAVPATQAILMAGGAIHGAVTAKPGERMKGAAKGAWDMSVPGMVVNTYEAGKAAYHSTADRLSSPSRMTTEQAQHFNQANAAYKADHQSGPITVEQFERTRRLPSGAVVTETVSTHTRARRD